MTVIQNASIVVIFDMVTGDFVIIQSVLLTLPRKLLIMSQQLLPDCTVRLLTMEERAVVSDLFGEILRVMEVLALGETPFGKPEKDSSLILAA